ncbi:hypothetical protein PO909_011431 [Leuciscus waleckii]
MYLWGLLFCYCQDFFQHTTFILLRSVPEGSGGGTIGRNMALADAWKQLSWFYYQYLLVTALYMLEPWERTVFNSLLITVAAMAVYTGYVFMPQHIMAILHYFEVVQ